MNYNCKECNKKINAKLREIIREEVNKKLGGVLKDEK